MAAAAAAAAAARARRAGGATRPRSPPATGGGRLAGLRAPVAWPAAPAGGACSGRALRGPCSRRLQSPHRWRPSRPRLPGRSWGAAQQGRLGTGQLEDAPYPELVPDLDGAEQLLGLACGLDHTLVLAAAAQQ